LRAVLERQNLHPMRVHETDIAVPARTA
jgi:hypothetical protein